MIKNILALTAVVTLTGCSFLQRPVTPQPLPPVKVITETVQLEIYQPPLPQEIRMQDVQWHVLTNTPCKPATGKHRSGYYTTERFQYDETVDEVTGETKRQVSRDEQGNRIELPQLTDDQGAGIEVCGNLEQKIVEIEKELGGDFVIMAITPKGYENMAYNLQEIKRYINQQKEIILYYREATSLNESEDKEGWIERNKQEQQEQAEDNNKANSQAPVQQQPVVEAPKTSGFLDKLNPLKIIN